MTFETDQGKQVDIHRFVTRVYNHKLNEFMLPAPGDNLGPSIVDGRIIYGKNKLTFTPDGYRLDAIRNSVLKLGVTPDGFSNVYSTSCPTFVSGLQSLYDLYLDTGDPRLHEKIGEVFAVVNGMVGNEHFPIKQFDVYEEPVVVPPVPKVEAQVAEIPVVEKRGILAQIASLIRKNS